jgi:ribosome maturation factor RimP
MGWQDALERTVQGLGYEVVDVERTSGGLLRVTIDRVPGHAYPTGAGEQVMVEDCEIVTRQLQYVLEVEAVEYARLEVSSPGLDRPLRKPADWQRFVGSEIELGLREPFQGRRRWKGRLVEREGGYGLLLQPEAPAKPAKPARADKAKKVADATRQEPQGEQVLDFALDEVREARLVPVIDFRKRRPPLEGEAAGQDGGLDR